MKQISVNKIVKLVLFLGLLFAILPSQEVAKAQNPYGRAFTFPADAGKGTMTNLVIDPVSGLILNKETSTFPFIWVAASDRDTVIKIDTKDGTIMGEFKTGPDNVSKSPSRTTVDLNGNVWVSNRANSVVHIGLKENSQCIDRNGNGVIDTSTGLGDKKAWASGGVANAADECIIHFLYTDSNDNRHMSLNKEGNLWTGGYGNKIFNLISSKGEILKKVQLSCGGYGGLIDKNGILWSATNGKLLRYDTVKNTSECLDANMYGMGIDGFGNIWGGGLGLPILKVSPDGKTITSIPNDTRFHRGVTTSANNDVWVAIDDNSVDWVNSSSTIVRYKNDGTKIADIPLTLDGKVGRGVTGVAVDAAGKVWATNYGSSDVMRVNPATNAVDLRVYLGSGAGPYNYSDMTGAVALNNTAPQGTWTTVVDGGLFDTTWQNFSCSVSDVTKMQISARTANTQAGLGSQTFVTGSNLVLPKGRFMQLEVKIFPLADGSSPVLKGCTFDAVNTNTNASDAPSLASTGTTTWSYGKGAVIVDPALTVTGNTNISVAYASIGTGFKASEDYLGISGQGGNSGTVNGLSWSYDSTKGTMTLSGSASTATYQAALRLVTYGNTNNSSNAIDKTPRKVDFSVGALAYPGNGHFYEYISSKAITWQDAKSEAEGRRLYGLQGYLGTMTSVGENSFVQDKVGGHAWLGGSDEAVEGTWKWVTGPESGTTFSFTAWAGGEPSNTGDEDYLHLYINKQWHDFATGTPGILGYVVEYGGMAGDPPLKLTGQATVNLVTNQPPTKIALDKNTVPENEDGGTVVGNLKATDPEPDDVHTYALVEGAGNSGNTSFTIVGNVLKTTAKFDYETQKVYTIRVQATDSAGNKYPEILTIDITDVDEAPTLSKKVPSVLVNENNPPDAPTKPTIINIVPDYIKDPEGGTLTCEANSSDTALVETKIENCVLTLTYKELKHGKATITVIVTDAKGNKTTTTFEVTVNYVKIDLQIKTTINSTIIKEDSTIDPVDLNGYMVDKRGRPVTYTAVSTNSGLITVSVVGTLLKFEVAPNKSGEAKVTVTGNAGDEPSTFDFTVKVLPVNDKPSFATAGNQPLKDWSTSAQSVANFAKEINLGTNETDQKVKEYIVTVVSGQEIFDVPPAVATDGTLTYKPNGIAGIATVRVQLRDNGGTENGGVDLSDIKTFTISTPRLTDIKVPVVVTSTNDDGPGSLRYALTYVAPGGTITFDPSLKDKTINLNSCLTPDVSVTIDGGSTNITFSGQGKSRVLCVNKAIELTFKGGNIVDGYGPKTADEQGGGGLLVSDPDAKVTLQDCTVANNKSDYEGGGIDGLGSLTIRRCTIADNKSKDIGGGITWGEGSVTIEDSKIIRNEAATRGGGIYASNVKLQILYSQILENKAKDGAGFYSDEYETGSFEVTGSTIAKNIASNWGGAFIGDIGSINNSTIGENQARGAGAFVAGVAVGQARARMIKVIGSTIYGNVATNLSNIGGMVLYGGVELKNSIVAGNVSRNDSGTIQVTNVKISKSGKNEGSLTSKGNNASDDTLGGIPNQGSDMFGLKLATEIKLNSLDYYGGKTQSRPPLPGSMAVDAGDNAACAADPINNKDQLNNTRPMQGHPDKTATCDIGAVELQDAWPKITEVKVTPTKGEKFVSQDATVVVKFNEPVTIQPGVFVVECPVGQTIALDIAVADPTSYKLTPEVPLPSGVTCRLTVDASKVKDKATIPNYLAGTYTSTFSTIPVVNVSVSASSGSEANETSITVLATSSASVEGDQSVSVAVTGAGIEATDLDGLTPSGTTIKINSGDKQGSVTFKIINDNFDEGTETAILTIGLPTANIALGSTISTSIKIEDNDTAGLDAPTGVDVVENTIGKFVLKLKSQPIADVTIKLTTTDANGRYTIPASVVLNSTNWNKGVEVDVTTINNEAKDTVLVSTVNLAFVSTDPKYNGLVGKKVNVIIQDDDQANVAFGISSFNLKEGETSSLPVKLTTLPKADVKIAFTSTNPTRCTVSKFEETIKVADWMTGITVTIIALGNDIDDGNADCTIKVATTSTDHDYNEKSKSVAVTVADDDTSGIIVARENKDTLLTTEEGAKETFTIKLTSQPTTTVTIGLQSSDITEGTVDSNVTFTPAPGNWKIAQVVTVTGEDDTEQDGNISYNIIILAAVNDGTYSGLNATGDVNTKAPSTTNPAGQVTVPLSNKDNDSRGFNVVSKPGGLQTSEGGASDTFTFKLNTQPAGIVVVQVVSSNPSEGIAEPSEMVFSPTNWSEVKTVKVTGVNDDYIDGDTVYTMTVSVKSTEDMEYKDFVEYVKATNTDDDNPGFTVDPMTLEVDEKGMSKTFTIVLKSKPASDVIVNFMPENLKGAMVSAVNANCSDLDFQLCLLFTPDNWNVPQEVIVTGLHDKTTLTDVTFKIKATIGKGTYDPNYLGQDPDDVTVTTKNINLPLPTADTTVAKVNLLKVQTVSVTIDVLANDTDSTQSGADDKASLTISSVTIDSTYGKAEIVDGKIQYTSSTDFVGTAIFSYTVKDSEGYTAIGVVTVDVKEIIPPTFLKSENGLSALISPSDGSTVGSRPTFTWQPALTDTGSLPTAYYVITLDPLPTGATVPLTSTTTSYTPPFVLPVGVYTWTVEAFDVEDNESGKFAPMARFTTKKTEAVGLYLPIILKAK